MPIHGYPGNVISATPPSVTVNGASGVFTTEQQMQYQAAGNWPMAATQISRSLRFNSADSAYLNRTPSSTTNQRTFTWSSWVKLSSDTPYRTLFSSGTTVPGFINFEFEDRAFTSPDLALIFNVASGAYAPKTTAVFRDFSAWYHIVVAVDTTQATESNRVKLYVNGVQQTLSAVGIPQNTDLPINTNVVHSIGRRNLNSNPDNYFNGYITDVYLIDGQALTPASFGQTNSNTGIWEPRQYTGPYGTNGFYLNFSDNSGTTSTTLGKDYSGNGNNWTPNNFSVTAGAGNDSLVDTPTPYGTDTGAGGEVRGNYATWNPLNTGNTLTLSNGNLYAGRTNANNSQYYTAASTFAVNSGKWYWEVYADFVVSAPGQWSQLGIVTSTISNFSNAAIGYSGALSSAYAYYNDGTKAGNGTATAGYGATFTTGDTIGVAFDADAGTITFYKNGVSQGQAFSGISMTNAWSPVFQLYDGTSGTTHGFFLNAGQRPFAYTAPSGFKALCTQNLPTPSIGATATTRADDYFNTVLYTGNGVTYPTTQSITGVGFQPDWVWIKSRSNAYPNFSFDAVRGAGKELVTNTTAAETNKNQLASFNSDGFSVANATDGSLGTNGNGATFVAWNWKANGAGSSNTSGTITSTVSANTTAGFSIATFTSPSSAASFTFGHGLGVAPAMVIVKRRSNTSGWGVWHQGLTSGTYYLLLESTAAQTNDSTVFTATPTSTVVNMGTAWGATGAQTMVAYCFAPVAGYSAFGSYVGNSSTDGPFIYTGFRPAWVMWKNSTSASQWILFDVKRWTYNIMNGYLEPNTADTENTGSAASGVFDILSNGFKLRVTGTDYNQGGDTYIYAAFAEFPFKYTLAR